MTSKSSFNSNVTQWELRRVYPYPDTPQIYLSGPFVNTTSWTDSVMYGANVPDWREKLRIGSDATTSLTGTRSQAHLTNGQATISYTRLGKPGREYLSGSHNINCSLPSQNPEGLDASKANAVALGRLNQSIRSVKTSFEGGIFLGEIGQTLRMFKNPAQGLRRAVDDFSDIARAIRRGRFRQAVRESQIAQNLADAWLEAQFGWRPFLSDVKGGYEALQEFKRKRGIQTCRVTGTAKDIPTESILESPEGFTIGNTSWKTQSRVVGTVSVIYRGAMRVEAKDPHEMDPELIGFDLASFVPTVWELIPYSFLIDYFTNVGDVIRGYSQMGIRLAWCNFTSRRTYTRTSWSEGNPPSGNVTSVAFAPAKFVGTKTHVSRQVHMGTIVPDLSFEIPGNWSLKWLNIAALVVSRNSDRKWVYGN